MLKPTASRPKKTRLTDQLLEALRDSCVARFNARMRILNLNGTKVMEF